MLHTIYPHIRALGPTILFIAACARGFTNGG